MFCNTKAKQLKKYLFLFIGVVFFVNVSCKKYPDGPLVDFHSKVLRLCRTWDVTYFSIDGNDSTDYLKHQPFYGTYTFERSNDGISISPTVGNCNYDCSNSNYSGKGGWGFKNNKNSIAISLVFNSNYENVYHMGPYRYDIPNISGI